MREEGWDRRPFLEEEEKEEDREAKRAGCSPWKRADIVALVALDGMMADMVAVDDMVAVADTEVAGNEVFLKRGES